VHARSTANGADLTRRFLGLTDDGAERLSYIEGTTDYPPPSEAIRSDEALRLLS